MERLSKQLAKPFVKRVGGKTQLLSDIKRGLPITYLKILDCSCGRMQVVANVRLSEINRMRQLSEF